MNIRAVILEPWKERSDGSIKQKVYTEEKKCLVKNIASNFETSCASYCSATYSCLILDKNPALRGLCFSHLQNENKSKMIPE